MPTLRQTFWAAMVTASVKVGQASWSSAICSTCMFAAMRCSHHLDDLGGVLADHMGSKNRVLATVDDELAESVGAAVGDGPEQVVVAGHTDDDVVVCGSLCLGEANPAVFGVAEAGAGDHVVDSLPGRSFCAATRPSDRAVWTSMERPLTSPTAKMCLTLVRK
jgi:hypothetical protein